MTKPDDVYEWDPHSDQPYVIRNRAAKRRLYLRGAVGSLKTFLIALLALPAAFLMRSVRPLERLPAATSAIGLGINVESVLTETTPVPLETLSKAVHELGIDHLLLRVPLGAASSLTPYLELAHRFAGKELLIDVLQDREHVADHDLLESHLQTVFESFAPYATSFKIGNAINRRKWAFVSLDEYFEFFRVAQRLRDNRFPRIKLLGGSIIDFELPNFARSLLHFAPIRYDAVAALLYVDRRGAPENTQFGVDLLGKIAWFRSLMRVSRKCADRLIITETNWPLVGTEPFAPAVGACMVDEEQQAAYLARYYLLAFASGQVETVYWHQLVAPGYGLLDNRGQDVRRRRAFYALKTMTGFFSGATITGFERRGQRYALTADRQHQRVAAIWTNDETVAVKLSDLPGFHAGVSPESVSAYGITGEALQAQATMSVTGDVTYLVQERVS